MNSEIVQTKWETVIGLEVHVQLSTKSKIFSSASTDFGAEPNTQACIIDLGLPGVLPTLNKEALRMAIAFGLATHSNIALVTQFARKNYFYPDLPKSYQISQLDKPIVYGGYIDILVNDVKKKIGITRAHLEEDAGKSIHDRYFDASAIDLNRAGTALLEVVSEPDLRSANEAVAYLQSINTLIRYLSISDGNMAEGSMRCDANVSIRPMGSKEFGIRTEVKNVNSFKFVEKAINFEVERQISILESGGSVEQETRLYDSVKNETRPMRSKEDAIDYRYFPDPDLPPFIIHKEQIEQIRDTMPELPEQKLVKFEKMGLSKQDSYQIAQDRNLAEYFEKVVEIGRDTKLAFSWVAVELLGWLNKNNSSIETSAIVPEHIGALVLRITEGTISGKIAKTIFSILSEDTTKNVDEIIEEKGLKQMSDSAEVENIVVDVIKNNSKQLEDYKTAEENKKPRIFGFFVGQVMKATQGKANPSQVNKILRKYLDI